MEKVRRNRLASIIIGVLQGIVIGVSGILPGISGGVLCILFGVYKPFMEVLASPVHGIKTHYKMLFPVGIGASLGFFMFVRTVSEVIETNEALAVAAFSGLILGTLPSLVREAGREKRRPSSYAAFFASFILLFGIFTGLKNADAFSVTPSFLWYVMAGAIWGVSIVLPGLSSSAILIFLGLLGPIADGAVNFDMSVLLPLALGGIGSLVLLARLINMLYEKHFSVMSHIIIGVVMATTLPILPSNFTGVSDAVIRLSLLALGFAVASVFEMINSRLKQ